MSRRIVLAAALIAFAVSALWPADAAAQRRGGRGPRGTVFVGGYFYDPFFGPYPWWGPAAYPYPYFPIYDDRAEVKLLVTPKEAGVYVDGYYAGIVDDFDGVLQSLPLSPGGHDISVYLEGYETVHQKLYLTARKDIKLRYTMKQLAPGQKSEVPEVLPPVPAPPPGSAMIPRPPMQPVPGCVPAGSPMAARMPPAPGNAPIASGYGTLMLRVQPGDADVTIDGERWDTSSPGERLIVQLAAGRHRLEIRKAGYTPYSSDITVQPGESTPLNVSLSSQ
jgi:hypothetical protein